MITVTRFTAMWCAPCRMVAPILNQLEEEFPVVRFKTVDIDSNPELTAEMGIRSVPTVIITNNNREAFRFVGPQTKAKYRAAIMGLFDESTESIRAS